ncbi:MAG: hypothetical protein A2504_13625 [Bdellovibrionales bacterium RIFOXYD12_FULL_39_22]|nr:MAG: hypothetical protein A2385_00350 [Bdellovibrionales bacterium RIFOXYB1_FULL_39_21]OFZ43872.1 MAG: hypothetical protein A2485_05180 [Bdellovibrionales bacterium RIFOXYC12_FULL_39_17]OFZ48794.1 MAG: hypothetical protein A2404_17665 [Bdellovibrionales bacterium RIFOXYC1_FULL_39_130]OFZ76527.1 MAG: hypothetical protein A2560_06330 [Bdellovibrionales bacterium RIFOXYD1_FULL_39_84]OFZ94761.1 MAG: hypothetical protein A2504_13625 [Bdellovibrionales bacterium RIFOXYD12_FULL_39_22]HLE12184.1 me
MSISFASLKFDKKILILFFISTLSLVIAMGIISYLNAKKAIYAQVEEKLNYQVRALRDSFETKFANIPQELTKAKDIAERSVMQQAKIINDFILKYNLTNNEEELKNLLSKFAVGQTGYVYILDYQGNYVLSSKRASDGKNIWNVQDANGDFVIQKIVAAGKALKNAEFTTISYPWKNQGETNARDKVAALFHIPEKNWVVGASAYYDDLIDFTMEKKLSDDFKTAIQKEPVGKTGYAYVMNSKGDLIIHPKQEGTNISQFPFIQQICKEKEGFISYDWEGSKKIVSYVYLKDKDYIIAAGSYLRDFTDELQAIFISTIASIIVALLLVAVISWYIKVFIKKLSTDLIHSSQKIKNNSNQISTGNQDLASRTQEQASALEETAATLEEITSTIKQTSENAGLASNLVVDSEQKALSGGALSLSVEKAMNEISDSSQKIVDITNLVDEIAFQTNILAINAAIEAAKAGESGKGFAVVAIEVRDLAQRASSAATDIKNLIDSNMLKIKDGSSLVAQNSLQLKDIESSVKKVAEIMADISKATKEQSSAIEEINKAVTELDSVTQQNSSLVEQVATNSQGLSGEADEMNRLILDNFST